MNTDPGTDPRPPILIVEDDAPLREIMEVLLEDRNRTVLFADSGHAALEAITAHAPSPVVIDLGLPDMHGFDLAREIRSREGAASERYLIAFTGYDSIEHRRDAGEAGFDEFLVKPMELDAMEETFARILAL